MAAAETRDFNARDLTRIPDKTTVELVNLAGAQIGHYTFQPGWHWSECINPVVGTEVETLLSRDGINNTGVGHREGVSWEVSAAHGWNLASANTGHGRRSHGCDNNKLAAAGGASSKEGGAT